MTPPPVRPCVIYNPSAGRGTAGAWLDRLRAALPDAEFRPTGRPGHAEELARQAALDGFGVVIAAGGDGTCHEVGNGLLRSGRAEVAFATFPIGSGNDYAFALGRAKPADALASRWVPRRVDVGRAWCPGGPDRYFVNCMGVGFNGFVTLRSRRIKWLRGMALYGLAIAQALVWHFDKPRMTVRFDDEEWQGRSLELSVLIGPREGAYPVRPRADLTDGLFDTLHARDMGRLRFLRYMPALAAGTLPDEGEQLSCGRCKRLSIRSDEPLCVHLDGEMFLTPADGHRELEVELLPGAMTAMVG